MGTCTRENRVVEAALTSTRNQFLSDILKLSKKCPMKLSIINTEIVLCILHGQVFVMFIPVRTTYLSLSDCGATSYRTL